MNRSLKLSMLMALALGSSQAMALDLGQVQIKSALGQPLLAEIPLHPANPAELRNLTVQLASSEAFARAGIAGGRTTIPLHFSIATTAGGQRVIRITSSVAVDDPFIDLLLDVNSKAGKSVREFAILLDPPGIEAAPKAPVASAPAARQAPSPAAVAHAPATPSPQATASHAEVNNGQYGPVKRGETLSSIARNAAPSGVDINQMLLALKQANPNAFYRDNINALKTGVVLRVPTSAQAQAMTMAAAIAEVRRENSDWRAGPVGKPTTVADAATRASASSAPTGATGGTGDRLALVPARATKGTAAPGGRTGGKDDKSAGLRQDLLRTQESLASLRQQSSDLKTRLKDLTDINTKNVHLLSLKDSEIADLQNKLAEARKAAALAAAAKPAPPASVEKAPVAAAPPQPAVAGTAGSMARTASSKAPAVAPPAASSAAPGAAGSAPAASKPATAATAAKPKPKPVEPVARHVPAPAAPPVSEQPWYMQKWVWGAGAAGLLLLLLGMLGRRRKSPAEGAPKSSSLADRFASTAPVDNGSDDIDQNELLDQLAEHPDDIYLHLELVTLYYSRRDVEHFEAAAEAMHAHITDPQQDEWQDVVHMGEDLVPDHPLFNPHDEPGAHEEAHAPHEFDIDHAADADVSTAVSSLPPSLPPSPPPPPKKVSEYNYQFDLTGSAARNEPAASDASPTHDTAVAPAQADTHATPFEPPAEPVSSWSFDEQEHDHQPPGVGAHEADEFSDDPVDTKLDLARAYLDMGDAEGARAMLGEVLREGTQAQQDAARRLLEGLH
ncbi:MAG: fimbrial protein FimV [Xanthomonadaceae bacterium]|nr:fimbrial protein FimV [Xanthomonadaceae bacterium]MDE3071390.1 fimbrial protein FimV [Pseudomonadota bacterium]